MSHRKHAEQKKPLRRQMRERRDELVRGLDRHAIARAIAEAGIGFLDIGEPGTVSGFYPFGSEIDPRPLLARLADDRWQTALPVVIGAGKPLVFRRWRKGEPLAKGVWNIPIPPPEAPAVDPDVLLVPLLAFDRKGFRLGYGGGFYDRTIRGLRQKKPIVAVGLAYAAQEVDDVLHDELDEPLDWVLTEKGAIRCG